MREGADDSRPLPLADVTPEEFEKFLWVFYNPFVLITATICPLMTRFLFLNRNYSIYDATIEDWSIILKLADKWMFHEVKELAIRELQKKPNLDLVSRTALYQKHQVDSRHLIPLYAQLCERGTPITVEEAHILGLETTMLINSVKEQLSAKAASGDQSSQPADLGKKDIFNALEGRLGLEKGSTLKFEEENTNFGGNIPTGTFLFPSFSVMGFD